MMRLPRTMFAAIMFFLFLSATAGPAAAASNRDSISPEGGVPVFVGLSAGFGDDNFLVFNGFGSIGVWELPTSDIWITGGLYTGVAILGDPTNKDPRGDFDPDNENLNPEGWGINPGASLGLTFGFVPQVDIHLLGYVGPSFALLSEFQRDGDGNRIKIDELDSRIGVSYGGVLAVAYTGNNPWLRHISLGLDGGFHHATFERWHLGFVIGIAF